VKKTQERQETQETHVANFYIPLFSFTLRKETNENKKNLKTQERQETHETHNAPVISLCTPFPQVGNRFILIPPLAGERTGRP
jgi:hypothetical protein